MGARHETDDGERHIRRTVTLDLGQLGYKRHEPRKVILPFFKFAFTKGAIGKTDAVFAENGLHRLADGFVEQFIVLGPRAEIFAAVHKTWQHAGDRKRGCLQAFIR